ncbi:MAG TPA: M42 family metallopeptidase [Chthoniobacteraceae bacterium]|jgi:endoglucanase|nr:M42 family metallopeptidase [Chthoniobacteraceae bacterium]
MDTAARNFLFDLLQTPSPTGFELPGQRKWAAYARQFAHRVENDAYGSVWATMDGAHPTPRKVMFEAHADEIGFIVKHISKEGFLRVDRIGGSDIATARGRRLDILGERGPVRGVIGNTAIHLRRDSLGDEKAPLTHDLYVDVGAASAEEVAGMGIRVGHPAVYTDAVEQMGPKHLLGRALDNRIGGFILSQVIANLSRRAERLSATVFAVNAVQEEIGGHGARMAAHRLMPDVCVVLDVTHATDTPGIEHAKHGEVKLGGGPSITHGTCNHPLVVQRLIEVAARQNIPLQHESSSRYSGTDTDVIFTTREGIPSALVSLPLRYMHSVVEMASLEDVERVISLLTAFAESITPEDTFAVRL